MSDDSLSDGSFDRSEFVGYFRDETTALLDSINADLLGLESHLVEGAVDAEIIDGIFRSLHTIKGSAGMLDFTDIQHLAHRLESLVDLLRSKAIGLDEGLLALIFTGRDLLSEAVERAVEGDLAPLPAIEPFLADLEAVTPVLGSAVGTLISDVLVPSASALALKPRVNSTIRVDLDRLDALLNLVGELVINRTLIAEIAHELQRTIEREARGAIPLAKDLAASASALARITNELQESVMKARMVPIGQVFERFPRTVRDLAKSTGKSINLVLSGVDTDLDKTIVDQIGEPLMHLVRNCVDHGIEMPEARALAKKPTMATIRLDAYHEGNQVIIEISDDGGGIDLRKIRARGIERGLIESDGAQTDDELIDLIFTPGFSTAASVSAISGRGVGMDVVKRSVTNLKGVLEVESNFGVGTTFTIRLPLTLAIIRTLLVRSAHRLYAIPLDVVVESQRIPIGEIRTIHGSPVVTLRGRVVPLLYVAREFDQVSDPVEEGYQMVVIVSHKGRHVGFVVDAFEGEQEIVIKPLSPIIGETHCIAGATILGNGSIALILDVAAMVNAIPASYL
jgi:two-component system chemotaxis sensor kinase CheA